MARSKSARFSESKISCSPSPFRVFVDLGIGSGVLVVCLVLGTILQQVLSRFEHSSAPLHSMVPQNVLEASAYLAAALTAGFVEEFVFRG
jgi:membrane protease YdiL (CAAX protease family)